jgi:hypothetical protein
MIVVLVILTWIPSRTRLKVSNTCPAYLPNWVDTWSDIATVLTGSLILMFILCAGIINLRLRRRTSVLCHDHRQAARELVHYLIVNMTILVGVPCLRLVIIGLSDSFIGLDASVLDTIRLF